MRRIWLVPTIPAAAALVSHVFTNRYQDQSTMSGGATADKFEVTKNSKGKFECAWGNFKHPGVWNLAKWKATEKNESGVPKDEKELAKCLPVLPVKDLTNPPEDKVQVTWIGHATVLVQFDGINILSDPMFSDYAGLTQYSYVGSVAGYKRYTKPACQVKDLPRIDAVIISHDHYDHLDNASVKEINSSFPDVKWFGGSGMQEWLCNHGCKEENVTELSWWKEKKVEHTEPQGQDSPEGKTDTPEQSQAQCDSQSNPSGIQSSDFRFICVPAQHWCIRGPMDENTRLWCGWVVKGPKHSYYFAGDTGYHTELFKKIGDTHGPFSISAIPIGAYKPRYIMTYQHVTPEEAVDIHVDVQSENSVGIHWGTFSMANEWYLEPPNALYDKMEQLKKEDGAVKPFVSLNLGETWKVGDRRKLPDFIGAKQPGKSSAAGERSTPEHSQPEEGAGPTVPSKV